MPEKISKDVLKGLRALANERRLKIIGALSEKGHMNVGDIAKAINLSFKSTSRHLQMMANADLLDQTRSSVRTFYTLNKQHPLFRSNFLTLFR